MNEQYVYKNGKRLFINTSLGCLANCSFCYLPQLGYQNSSFHVKAEDILTSIRENHIEIEKDTLITLGCYSECLDAINHDETIALIQHFLKCGNQVQVSTKRQLTEEDIKSFQDFIQYEGQFVLFVSSSTLSRQKEIEKNTLDIEKRFKNFQTCHLFHIPCVLYIKPVLEHITIQDLELYKKCILKYAIQDVVVGSLFTTEKGAESVSFGQPFFYHENHDEQMLIEAFSSMTKVYRRSTEVMKSYKR